MSSTGEMARQNGEPPSSTLAAQLVQQFTDVKKRHRVHDNGTFRQLLDEVLGAKTNSSFSNIAHQSGIDVDFRLIYVIVKAGIEQVLHSRNVDIPAALVIQTKDSLAAVDLTLRRNPDVLFAASSGPDVDSQYRGELYKWLLPKLFSLIRIECKPDLSERVSQTLRTIVLAERKIHPITIERHAINMYIRGCTCDLIRYLGIPSHERAKFSRIPSASTLSELNCDSTSCSVMQDGAQFMVDNPTDAFNSATRLISIMAGVDLSGQIGSKVATSSFPARVWILDAMTQIWIALYSERLELFLQQSGAFRLDLFLEVLRSYHNVVSSVKPDLVTSSRASSLLSSITVSLLKLQSSSLLAKFEIDICLNIFALVKASSVSSNLRQVIDEGAVQYCIQIITDTERLKAMGHDLQIALSLLIKVRDNQREPGLNERVEGQQIIFRDTALSRCYSEHIRDHSHCSRQDGHIRPSKRLRLSTMAKEVPRLTNFGSLPKSLDDLLKARLKADLEDLPRVAVERYIELSDAQQCLLFRDIGRLACQSAYASASGADRPGIETPLPACPVCDLDTRAVAHQHPAHLTRLENLLATITDLVKLPEHQKSTLPRVAAMSAAHRVLCHQHPVEKLDLSISAIGQWCLQALQSSLRELRIAAGRTLPVFLHESLGQLSSSKNRLIALDYLRSLSSRSDMTLQETCVLAWGHVARNLNDGDEMNLSLLKLIEYLGHPNALISGLAYDELQRLCNHSPFSAMKLFAPYWRTIAVTIVQDLYRRPQIAQQVSELLAMNVPDFLVLTQMHTIPYFVLQRRHEILQRIADACGLTIMTVCREHSNLAAILSSVLLKISDDVEAQMMALLNGVSPEFASVNCADLLKSEPQATATELLKIAGEDVMKTKPDAHRALHYLAGVTHAKPTSSRGVSRRSDVIGPFFESHVLGIMAILADTINDGKGPQPNLEKTRCLGAIREMIKTAKGSVSNGLPQICACLRSAISNPELSNEGFQTWIVMMGSLGEDEIASLVDPTFAIMVQFWDSFAPATQTQAHDMVSHLLKAHASLISDIIDTLPSLAGIPLMSKFEKEISGFKLQLDTKQHLQAFSRRCKNENAIVVSRALVELVEYLELNGNWIYETAISEQPDPVVGQLTRAVLDTSVNFQDSHTEILVLCAKCLGMIGCLDPIRVEAIKEKKEILVVSNFTRDDEIRDFIIFFLPEVLVKAFLSATNSRNQGFLAYAMQELLSIGDFQSSVGARSRDLGFDANYRRWNSLPESMRTLLTPFLDSKYFVTAGVNQPPCTYPLFRSDQSHKQWLRTFTFDLLKKDIGDSSVRELFSVLSRVIRSQDITISEFLLPFAILNVVLNGTDNEKMVIAKEVLAVLSEPLAADAALKDNLILCGQTIFHVLDYLSRWLQEKRKELASSRTSGTRTNRGHTEAEMERDTLQISSVEAVLAMIPADIISRRAVECKSYARALFHWEQYIRQERQRHADIDRPFHQEPLYTRLQDIYAQIDEPDGIEGVSAHLQVLNIDQQILEHKKAGRWTAAQSWYEILLAQDPNDLDIQRNLLISLRESGQHDVLLNQVQGFQSSEASRALAFPFAAEASWVTGKWDSLKKCVLEPDKSIKNDFNIGIGRALLELSTHDTPAFSMSLVSLRREIARGLSATNAASLQACRDTLLKFHVISELEAIGSCHTSGNPDKAQLHETLGKRLGMLGPFVADKQYVLGVRRAAMELCQGTFTGLDISSVWLASARLARKCNSTRQAFDAVLHASQLGDESATIEHSRLLWREGSHRKAIQSLQGANAAGAFRSRDTTQSSRSMASALTSISKQPGNILKAKAHLLLAKWVDRAGQTQSDAIVHEYRQAISFERKWEKGNYYLGKHYNKLLESEKAQPPSKQAQTFISGETAKLVVENYLRSLSCGVKYHYQTVPRILTLWLDMGASAEQVIDPQYGDENFRSHTMIQRRKMLTACNEQVEKYLRRLPSFFFYCGLSQIIARICHPNKDVYRILVDIVVKVVSIHSAQALWALLALVKSSSKDRASRGHMCISKVQEQGKRNQELKMMVAQGQRISDQLLHVCEGDIQPKASNVSLERDLGFKHKGATCKLAIPLEKELTASLPVVTDVMDMKDHKAFSKDYVHISCFQDDVLVLNSLQRPRKISIRGSDGRVYALLCKPKDDLRKDQRLMEFNAMINRALKKDAESSKRRLYIKTYAVTPLNEECGLIEWVDNLKTLREILLNSYKQKSVHINYTEIRNLLTEAISAPSKLPIFTDKIIPHFPPVFHEWFVDMFPDPGAWFAARLRYTRSCAVMSIVGHVLGLGDRHGENILFEEGNGGSMHVDFNCLFDKGLTFEKPELVPFRLTHNMVDAFGAQGHEGSYRRSCELTLGILRSHEDTLMTILETFLYDPTTDFIGKKKKANAIVPDTPEGVLEAVRNKVRGRLKGESVPLSVEGYTDELIKQARDPWKLASMYIGWCAFF